MPHDTNSPKAMPLLAPDCERLSRRQMLGFAASFTAFSLLPVPPSFAAPREPRFLLVILRGGLDGLAAVMPAGDPEYARVRGAFAEDLAKAGEPLKLDAMFALNPALKALHQLYAKREALIVHATATPYRERSHFDGQEILESGLPAAVHPDTGWLNRALAELKSREKANMRAENGVSIGPTVPLVMRGPAPVLSWTPKALPQASDDTAQRLLALYEARDPLLAEALRRGVLIGKETKGMEAGMASRGPQAVLAMAEGAAKLLAKADGPRVGTLSVDGWDTHAEERPGTGRLGQLLGVLDKLLATIEQGLAPVWKDTVVAVVTEFGRTVRVNGTAGTDHGTATTAFLLGGAVKGGRVLADWPGLGEAAMHEKRDLKPTTDLRAVLKGVLVEHLGLDAKVAADRVFPESGRIAHLAGLVG